MVDFLRGTYKSRAVAGERGCLAGGAAGVERAVGGGVAAEVEGLAAGVHGEVVDGRGGAGCGDAESSRLLGGSRAGSRGGGRQQREERRGESELHCDGGFVWEESLAWKRVEMVMMELMLRGTVNVFIPRRT